MRTSFKNGVMSLVVIAMASWTLLSCNNETSPSIQKPTENHQWMKSINYAMDASEQGKLGVVKLLGYEYVGKVESAIMADNLCYELTNDNAEVAVSHRDDNNAVEMVSWAKIRELDPKFAKENSPDVLREMIEVGKTDIIRMKWVVGDQEINTTALANENAGIFYDPIGTFLVSERISEENETNSVTRTIPQNVRVEFKIHEERLNSFGGYIFKIDIYCYSYFDIETGILKDTDYKATYSTPQAFPRHYADAKIKSVAGIIDTSLYHQFAWAWVESSDGSAIISYMSVGFSVNVGTGSGENGGEVHRAPSQN